MDPLKAYVAVTDNDWYRFLRQRPELDEVNFWQPGGKNLFRQLEVGQPFLFKLHHPQNFVAGGGFFTHASLLPLSFAWDAFGEKNGAASLDELRRLIERYHGAAQNPLQNYKIGCIILQNPFFFDEDDWIQPPDDFHPNIVQGKTYDLRSSTGRALWGAVQERWSRVRDDRVAEQSEPMYREPSLVRLRLGQGTFRVLVTDKYQRQCAVTREKALPVLDAAHIRPVSEGGVHRIDNGLLLRSDVHTLLDRGYVTVGSDYRFRVSRRLKTDFDNGEYYYQFQGAELWLPPGVEDRPKREFLEWHTDTVFRR